MLGEDTPDRITKRLWQAARPFTDDGKAAHRNRALRDPWVGLALDPERRMAPGQVPAQTVGQVRAREINRVSKWLRQIAVRRNHPQKIRPRASMWDLRFI